MYELNVVDNVYEQNLWLCMNMIVWRSEHLAIATTDLLLFNGVLSKVGNGKRAFRYAVVCVKLSFCHLRGKIVGHQNTATGIQVLHRKTLYLGT